MVTREQGLMAWASRWRELRAWRHSLADIKVEVSDRAPASRLGTCWAYQRRVTIYRGDSFIEELGTLLHELAHAATIGDGHDETWQDTFASAVTEVTHITVVPAAYNYRILNAAAKDALKAWWHVSGEARIWKLARGQVT